MRHGFLIFTLTALLSGCASSKMTVTATPQAISRLAIAPGSGVLGEAIAVELFNSGIDVADANEACMAIGRVGLKQFELTSPEGFAALRESGIEAVLAAQFVIVADGTPESASVRITSTATGKIVARIIWQNAWAGVKGSMADRNKRRSLSGAAREIARKIVSIIQVPGAKAAFLDAPSVRVAGVHSSDHDLIGRE